MPVSPVGSPLDEPGTWRLLRIVLATVVLFATAALSATFAAAQAPAFLPGSSWGVVLPPGFALDPDSKALYVHPSGAIIVIVTSMQPHDPTRFSAVGTIAGTGNDQGRVESIEPATVGGRSAHLLHMRMVRRNADSFVMAVQGETAGLITVMVPDTARPVVTRDTVMAVLNSATERPLTTAQRLEGLPFSIGDLAGMRVSGTISGLGVILTQGPGDRTADTPDQPFVTLIAHTRERSENHVLARDPALFARHLEQSFPRSVVTKSGMVDGAQGRMVELSFNRRTGDFDRPGVAWAFRTGTTVILMIVQLPAGHDPAKVSSFTAMRDSISGK